MVNMLPDSRLNTERNLVQAMQCQTYTANQPGRAFMSSKEYWPEVT